MAAKKKSIRISRARLPVGMERRVPDVELPARAAAGANRNLPVTATANYEERRAPRNEEEQRKEDIRQFIELAHERFQLAEEAESVTRRESLDDFQFSIGEQWSADIKNQRTVDARPCLTMNRLPQFINQVTNEQRQQRPSGQVNPVGSGSNVETAEALQGMVRHIEVNSDAEIVYDTAFDHMVRGGFGWWRLVTEYINDENNDQEIKLKWVKNPFCVHFDPFCQEPDYSDANWAFIFEDIPYKEYRRQYLNSELASWLDSTGSIGNIRPNWMTQDTVRVAEYFHVEYETHTLDLMSDGSFVKDGVLLPGSEATVVSSRKIQKRRVVWDKINAIERLETTDWAGKWIPIIPVTGLDLIVNGKRHLAGLVRNAKDPQRMYNYHCSAATEAVALAPKAPWVVVEGQISGFERQWEQSNVRTQAVLTYKSTDVSGKPAPAPQRNAVEPPIQAMTLLLREAAEDLNQTTGIFPPTLGENPRDQSGKAVALLQKRSDISNLNWIDNLSRSIRHSTRALLDLIPHVYDTPRVQRIINPDGSAKHVGIYNSTKPQQPGAPDPREILEAQGVKKIFDIGVGTYDVTVSVGPSYQSKRQEAVAGQVALISAYPAVMAAAGDILVRNMDWPQAEEIADRLKRTLPPQVLGDDDEESAAQRAQAQLAQMTQQHQVLAQALQQANQIIETKQVEALSREKIALLQERTKIIVAQINASKDADKLEAQKLLAQLDVNTDAYLAAHDAAHEAAMAGNQQAHEQSMAAQQQVPPNGSAAEQNVQ